MYTQIARNKRLAVVYMGLFFLVWVGIGALLGLIAAHVSAQPGTRAATGADVLTGAVIFAVLALSAFGLVRWLRGIATPVAGRSVS